MEPKLAPPGAGLPKVELFIARGIFKLRRLTGSRASFTANFESEREAIGALVRGCSPESAARRVLIQRVAGLEDSSRYWSVWMTLDHLRIVNKQIALVIAQLSRGVDMPGKGDTARVKPSVEVTAEVVAEYENTCESVLDIVARIPDLKSAKQFAHPWFGPLDAAGWHALAGSHMNIHRKQIERIIAGGSAAENEETN